MLMNRRGVLGGLASMLAAPAIVHAGNLMPIKVMRPALDWQAVDVTWVASGPTTFSHFLIYSPQTGKIIEREYSENKVKLNTGDQITIVGPPGCLWTLS